MPLVSDQQSYRSDHPYNQASANGGAELDEDTGGYRSQSPETLYLIVGQERDKCSLENRQLHLMILEQQNRKHLPCSSWTKRNYPLLPKN